MSRLFVLGSGIKSIAHLTKETTVIIKEVDKVLYLLNEDSLKQWVEEEAKIAESLEPIYFSSSERSTAYQEITKHIVNQTKQYNSIAVMFYGHPTVYAQSALEAAKQIQNDNGFAVILPAISFMDNLFSDLQIDPGENGCFSIDATELLLYERNIDPHSHNFVSQVGNLGQTDQKTTTHLNVLTEYLSNFYELTAPVCIYEASQLPSTQPKIQWLTIQELADVNVTQKSTLYIPPNKSAELSQYYASKLGLNLSKSTK